MDTNLNNTTEPLLAFIDEIGDRGYSTKSSKYFAMTTVIFPVSVQQSVKNCISGIKTRLGIPLKNALHWRKHCQKHEVKNYVIREIAKLKGITVIFVISDKKTMSKDHSIFYNAVAALTLERILRHTEKLNTKVSVWFGHVRGFNHTSTIDYFNNRDWKNIKYSNLLVPPTWIPAENNSGIQLADQYAGMLGSAMIMDNYGGFEPAYLEKIKHHIRKSDTGKISGYGIKAISADENPKSFDWWPKGWK